MRDIYGVVDRMRCWTGCWNVGCTCMMDLWSDKICDRRWNVSSDLWSNGNDLWSTFFVSDSSVWKDLRSALEAERYNTLEDCHFTYQRWSVTYTRLWCTGNCFIGIGDSSWVLTLLSLVYISNRIFLRGAELCICVYCVVEKFTCIKMEKLN